MSEESCVSCYWLELPDGLVGVDNAKAYVCLCPVPEMPLNCEAVISTHRVHRVLKEGNGCVGWKERG